MGEHYPHPAERSADRFFEDWFPVTIMLCRLARVRRNLVPQHWLRRLLDLYRVATVDYANVMVLRDHMLSDARYFPRKFFAGDLELSLFRSSCSGCLLDLIEMGRFGLSRAWAREVLQAVIIGQRSGMPDSRRILVLVSIDYLQNTVPPIRVPLPIEEEDREMN